MSWYNSFVLSFSWDECDDDEDDDGAACHVCEALRGINAWLEQQGYEELKDLNSDASGVLGSNAVLFGGCYDKLDVDAFFAALARQPWKHRNDVTVLFWGDNDSKCSVFGLPPPAPARD